MRLAPTDTDAACRRLARSSEDDGQSRSTMATSTRRSSRSLSSARSTTAHQRRPLQRRVDEDKRRVDVLLDAIVIFVVDGVAQRLELGREQAGQAKL